MSARHPYASAWYAKALAADGKSRAIDVPEWSTFVLARPIAGGGEDAMGPYPRTPLAPGSDLQGGLERLRAEGLVSVVFVTDAFTVSDPACLRRAFAICAPFKTHQVIHREAYAPTKHHRYEIRRARERCDVAVVRLGDHLDAWRGLYAGLVARHGITGAAAFSEAYFQRLAEADGLVTFAARSGDRIVAMSIWFEHDGESCNHLAASDEAGYAVGASYALYDAAVAHFACARRFDLGAGAGLEDDPDDGLARFKRGFANATATAWLCGAVLDAERYAALTGGRRTGFFPAYRG